MAAPIFVDRHNRDPRIDELDRDHPLAQGLLFYVIVTGPHIPVDLVAGHQGTQVGGTLEFELGSAGWYMQMIVAGRITYGRTLADEITTYGTLAVVARPYGNPSSQDMLTTGEGGAGGYAAALALDNTAIVNDGLVRYCDNGSGGNSGYNFFPNPYPIQDYWHTAACSWNGSGTTFRLQSGLKITDTSVNAQKTPTAHANRETQLFTNRLDSSNIGRVRIAAIWDHELTDAEWELFERDPDLRAKLTLDGATAPAGGAQTLTGTSIAIAPSVSDGAFSLGGVSLTGTSIAIGPSVSEGTLTQAAAPQTLDGTAITSSPAVTNGAFTLGGVTLDGTSIAISPSIDEGSFALGVATLAGTSIVIGPSVSDGQLVQAGAAPQTLAGTAIVIGPTVAEGAFSAGPASLLGTVISMSPSVSQGVLFQPGALTRGPVAGVLIVSPLAGGVLLDPVSGTIEVEPLAGRFAGVE